MGRRRGGRRRACAVGAEQTSQHLSADAQAFVISQFIDPVAKALAVKAARRQTFARTTQQISEIEFQRGPLMYARAKPAETLSFETLASIAKYSPINSAIHGLRTKQLRRVARKWDGRRSAPGWAVVHEDHNRPDFDATKIDGLDARIRRVEGLLAEPHPELEPKLKGMLVKLLENHLAYDRACINVLTDRAGRGVPVNMVWVDGATIWPAHLWLQRWTELKDGLVDRRNLEVRAESLWRDYGVDFDRVRWVQIDPTFRIEACSFLTADDLIVGIERPSAEMNHWGFGISPCESSFVAASLSLRSYGYLSGYYQHALSELVAIVAGDYQDGDIEALTAGLRTDYSGDGKHWKMPLIKMKQPGDLVFESTRKSSARDMVYPEVEHRCAGLIAAAYGADLSEINIDPRGPGQSSLSEPARGGEQHIKLDTGFIGDLEFLADMLTDVIHRVDPDLRFVWHGVNEQSEQHELELRQKRLDAYISIDEARQEEGRAPWDQPWSRDVPKFMATQAFAQMAQEDAGEEDADTDDEVVDVEGAQEAPDGNSRSADRPADDPRQDPTESGKDRSAAPPPEEPDQDRAESGKGGTAIERVEATKALTWEEWPEAAKAAGDQDEPRETYVAELWAHLEDLFGGFLGHVLNDLEGMLHRGEITIPLDHNAGHDALVSRRIAIQTSTILRQIGLRPSQDFREVDDLIRREHPWMIDLIDAGYRLGLIHQAVAPETRWETAWRVARERPMTSVDHAAVKFLKSKGAAYFRPVLDGATTDTVKRLTWHQEIAQARVLGSVTGTTPELHGRRIGPERLSGLMADLTGRRVDRGDGKFIWSGGSWARDWRRVARTELQFASSYGHLIDQLQRHPVNSGELPAGEVAPEVAGHFQVGDEQLAVPKALVYKVPQQVRRDEAGRLLAPCTHCHRIWYADDETPRLYPLMDVINAGENFGRAAADWQATVGPTHPNCVCGQLRSYDPVARNLFPGFNKQIEKLRGQDFEGVD